MRHVLRLPQQVPWTGQPGRTTGLERLGFYGDTWAALRAGLRAALRAGLQAGLRAVTDLAVPGRRAVPCVGPPQPGATMTAPRTVTLCVLDASDLTDLGLVTGPADP